MCFGVRDAIALALEHADAGPLTILGDLVQQRHRPDRPRSQRRRGRAGPRTRQDAHGDGDGPGTSSERSPVPRIGDNGGRSRLPLVRVAHRAVAALARDGYHVVIVGQRDHVEVRGLTGDLERNFDVVLDDDDVNALADIRASA